MTIANPPAASGYMSVERRIGMLIGAIGVYEPMLAEHPFGAVPIATDQAWISDHNESSLLPVSSSCRGSLRTGPRVSSSVAGSVRLNRDGTCRGGGPYRGGRPGSGLPEVPVCGV